MFYIDKTGQYDYDNITQTSTLVDNKFISFDEIKTDNELVIAIGHYTLKEWLDERNIPAMARVKTVSDFKGYKHVLLGDIHCRKKYGNCRYAGSLIQQNFGEISQDHGFSVYNITTDKWSFTNISSEYSFKNISINNEGNLILPNDFTEKSYIKLRIDSKHIINELSYKKEMKNIPKS